MQIAPRALKLTFSHLKEELYDYGRTVHQDCIKKGTLSPWRGGVHELGLKTNVRFERLFFPYCGKTAKRRQKNLAVLSVLSIPYLYVVWPFR